MRLTQSVAAAALVLVAVLAASGPARAALTAEQVAQQIAEAYGVRVLKIAPTEIDGRAAFRVTVMKPGGNANDAFRVTTLAVDAETGKLIPQFRHRASGYELSGAPRYEAGPSRPDAAEKGIVWR